MKKNEKQSFSDDETRLILQAFRSLKWIMKKDAIAMDAVHEHTWPGEQQHNKDYEILIGLLDRFGVKHES